MPEFTSFVAASTSKPPPSALVLLLLPMLLLLLLASITPAHPNPAASITPAPGLWLLLLLLLEESDAGV
jgi:hypothetical protein